MLFFKKKMTTDNPALKQKYEIKAFFPQRLRRFCRKV